MLVPNLLTLVIAAIATAACAQAPRPIPNAAARASLTPGDHTRTLQVSGSKRSYLVHVPRAYDGSSPLPVVLVFHGGGSNPRAMVEFTGLNDKADVAGFLAVYPSGTGRLARMLTFNGGNCCGYAQRHDVDDVAFVRALLDDIERVARIDKRRVFATGMSNGAIMSYRLASEMSDRIAAIAPVGGPMGTSTCHPRRPVPVIHFHGTADEFAPFAGGHGAKSLTQTNFLSVDHSIQAWVKANGCPAIPRIEKLPDAVDDGLTATRTTYGPCRSGSEVVLITIQGGGHTWPGREPTPAYLGKSSRDVTANDLMWEFFQKHPLPE